MHRTDGDAVVSVKQHIVDRLDYLGLGGDIQCREQDSHRIAQVDVIDTGHIRIFLGLMQRNKGHIQAHSRSTDVIVLNIFLTLYPEFLCCGSGLEIGRKVHNLGSLVRVVGCGGGMQHLFRQIHDHIRTVLILTFPEGADASVGVLDVLFLFQIRQVLAIADGHAIVLAPVLVEDSGKVIKFPFAAECINDGTFLTEQKRSEVAGLRHLEGIRQCRTEAALLRNGEGVVLRRVGHKPFKGRFHAGCRKGHHRDVGHLIADVFRIDLHHTGQGLGDPVNAKRLRSFSIRWGCVDDAGILDFLHELAIDGILHVEFILTVSLFGHLAGNRIREASKTIC